MVPVLAVLLIVVVVPVMGYIATVTYLSVLWWSVFCQSQLIGIDPVGVVLMVDLVLGQCCSGHCRVSVGGELVLVLAAVVVSDPTTVVGVFVFSFLTLFRLRCFPFPLSPTIQLIHLVHPYNPWDKTTRCTGWF